MQSYSKSSVIEFVESQPWSESTKKTAKHKLFKMFSISTDPNALEQALIRQNYSRYTIKQYFIIASKFNKTFKDYYEKRKGLFKNAYKTKTKNIEESAIREILNNSGQFYNIIYLMSRCGLRLSEAISLKSSDLVSNNLFAVTGKGDKQRLVPCNVSELINFPSSPGELVGGSVDISSLRQYLKRYDVTPHDLRAFFITTIARSKVLDLDEIQVVVGHSSLLTTQRYLRQNINEIQAKLLGGAYEVQARK